MSPLYKRYNSVNCSGFGIHFQTWKTVSGCDARFVLWNAFFLEKNAWYYNLMPRSMNMHHSPSCSLVLSQMPLLVSCTRQPIVWCACVIGRTDKIVRIDLFWTDTPSHKPLLFFVRGRNRLKSVKCKFIDWLITAAIWFDFKLLTFSVNCNI